MKVKEMRFRDDIDRITGLCEQFAVYIIYLLR
jgi:hypothetical protein